MKISRLLILIAAATLQTGYGQLQSPDAYLGYQAGSDFTPHHRVVDYFEHVAQSSPTVRLVEYGRTYEGRPLLYAIVASNTNMESIETIRLAHLRHLGLEEGRPGDDPQPAIVWLSYNVHGNEAVGTEAAMQTLYSLADTSNASASRWLENTVAIIDPCLNPDGRDRYVFFYRRTVGKFANPRPEAWEHNEPWPGGRTNHYFFDLNRDWAWGSQVETRQRLAHYQRWMSHVHVDFHEQQVDSPYYFAPAAEPYHVAITDWQREAQNIMGQNHARHFDANGWLYFTRQVFDLFYPGYGDTWPMFNGAIGMTYEQGGSGRAGLAIITAEGDTLTLADRIRHHHMTGLSTVEVAALQQQRLVSELRQFFLNPQQVGPYQAFVMKAGPNLPGVARHLDMQGITYTGVAHPREASGYSYQEMVSRQFTVEPGDLVVDVKQPRSILAQVLMDPAPILVDSVSYDITAWSLPYVHGINAYALEEPVAVESVPWKALEVTTPRIDRPAAWLAEWNDFEDARLLASLLQRGIRVRFSEVAFTIGERRYAPGTLIITRAGNHALGSNLDSVVRHAASTFGQPLTAAASTLVHEGVDFGSPDVPHLRAPDIGIIAGEAIRSLSVGELWHYFDQQLGYPATLISEDDFRTLNLQRYDVLVFAHGSYDTLITDHRHKDLRDWVRAGGKMVLLEGAVRYFAGKEGFGLKTSTAPEDSTTRLRRYGDREREAVSSTIPGAVFRVSMDSSHPLAFGYPEEYFTMKRGTWSYPYLEDGWNVGALAADPYVSGFVGSEVEVDMPESLIFGVEAVGLGEVVYMVDNPVFRAFWHSGRLLLANAVFLVGQRTPADF